MHEIMRKMSFLLPLQVILDAVKQVCDTLQLKNSMEMLEFTMYGIIGPGQFPFQLDLGVQ